MSYCTQRMAAALALLAATVSGPTPAADTKEGYFTTNDRRDMLSRITVPTLIVGGKSSLVGWKSQVWISAQIPGAQVEIFEEEEGGNHLMFMENP